MTGMKLSGKGNLAHEIVDAITEDLRREEMIQVAKVLLEIKRIF